MKGNVQLRLSRRSKIGYRRLPHGWTLRLFFLRVEHLDPPAHRRG